MTGPPVDPAPELLSRVASTRSAQEQAAAVHDQAIRDAKAAGHPVTRIAGILGVANRGRLYEVIAKSPDAPTAPTATPVAYLRGAGVPPQAWRDVETAMHRRGLATVRDRQQAWHLARGGVPVVFVDFSASSATATAGLVKARWKTTQQTRTVGQLITRADRERLIAEGVTWLDTSVTVEERNGELPLADPTSQTHVDNRSLDPDGLAMAVIAQLA